MHGRLVNYLKDSRDQIIENWLTEAEVPGPDGQEPGKEEAGIIPLAFFSQAFETVLEIIANGKLSEDRKAGVHLDDFLGLTASCKQRCFGGRVCIELHDSGLKAFLSVFDEAWDAEHEFNELDRQCSADLINHALSGLFASEIEFCKFKKLRSDCPFVADLKPIAL